MAIFSKVYGHDKFLIGTRKMVFCYTYSHIINFTNFKQFIFTSNK